MSKMPAAIWVMTYADDSDRRRKHRHRCRVCNRIVQGGEATLAARIGGGKTKVIHEACAALQVLPDRPFTHRDLLEAHGISYLASCGWSEAKKLTETMPIFRP